MRHAKRRYQLGRFTSWHDATIISLARNIIINQSIKTTLHRAKASRQAIEKLISLAKENTLFARRRAQEILGEHRLVKVLFEEIGPRFSKRAGGFTRIIGMGKRRGDDAEMVILELTEIKKKEIKKSKSAKKENKPVHAKNDEAEPAESRPVEEGAEKEKSADPAVKEKPAKGRKPEKKFIGGIRNIFKKKSDSL
ncbi:MAG: 50S ribosomal protein L17 [Candidatus Omnitrophica bacterium]|jgi:large subunit ribosomal protein L17|nr:50S ribosomal protein L17 [Candidatus Omnitrophota bacterium]MDD5500956.1 50S ribosomal protein L17 [Candidatus Omnitrophota bacterium]